MLYLVRALCLVRLWCPCYIGYIACACYIGYIAYYNGEWCTWTCINWNLINNIITKICICLFTNASLGTVCKTAFFCIRVKILNVPILDATIRQLCNDTGLDCKQGCRLKSGTTGTTGHTSNDVECFCNDGFKLEEDNKTCTGNILVDYVI